MAGELVPRDGWHGLESVGPVAQMGQQILANYHNRGLKAAHLVLATLTESAYTPTIDGYAFGQDVSYELEPNELDGDFS